MSGIEEHEQALIDAFARVLRSEEAISGLKSGMDMLKRDLELQERELAGAWQGVADLMASTGEPEVTLPGAGVDYKIGWTPPRESVKVDADAVPDEFCKIERKPKLKEIAEHLNGLRDSAAALPNWGSFQLGASRLTWKAIKKSHRGEAA